MANDKIRLAILNGQKTKARKAGRHWLVGGDFVSKGDVVTIAMIYKDPVWGKSRWAWGKLKGCFLVLDDFMTGDEIEEQNKLNA